MYFNWDWNREIWSNFLVLNDWDQEVARSAQAHRGSGVLTMPTPPDHGLTDHRPLSLHLIAISQLCVAEICTHLVLNGILEGLA